MEENQINLKMAKTTPTSATGMAKMAEMDSTSNKEKIITPTKTAARQTATYTTAPILVHRQAKPTHRH
jgi:hypothetical protein